MPRTTRRVASALVRLALLGGVLGGLGGVLLGGPHAQAQAGLRAVAFDKLADGESATAGAALLRLVTSPQQGAELARLADRPDLAAALRGVDFTHQAVVAIFAGPMGSSGHGLGVKAVQAGPDAVHVTVELVRPRPEQNVNDVISYPYALVAVPRAALPAAGLWTVADGEGRVLLRQRR